MPQMAPMNWMSLMIYFIMIFFMLNILNFYTFNYFKNKLNMKIKNLKVNWKW